MLKMLLESRTAAGRGPNARWGAASVATHAILIVGAVAATATHAPRANATEPRDTLIYVPVERHASPRPTTQQPTTLPPITTPGPIVEHRVVFRPDFNCDPGAPVSLDSLFASITGDTTGTSTTTDPVVPNDGVYEAATVDRAVVPFSDNPQPSYPTTLRAAGIEGSVLARFVVDTLGRVEPGSIAFVAATHDAFSESVRYALRHSRFTPARVGQLPVRQLVEQRFSFALER